MEGGSPKIPAQQDNIVEKNHFPAFQFEKKKIQVKARPGADSWLKTEGELRKVDETLLSSIRGVEGERLEGNIVSLSSSSIANLAH